MDDGMENEFALLSRQGRMTALMVYPNGEKWQIDTTMLENILFRYIQAKRRQGGDNSLRTFEQKVNEGIQLALRVMAPDPLMFAILVAEKAGVKVPLNPIAQERGLYPRKPVSNTECLECRVEINTAFAYTFGHN